MDSGRHVDLERGDHAGVFSHRHRRRFSPAPAIRRRCAALVAFAAYCAALIAIVVGFSLAASVLFLRYRDLNQVWEVVMQAGFFLAPIIYPLDILPERFHFYLYLWPPTPVIEFSRSVLVARRDADARPATCIWPATPPSACWSASSIFRRLSPRAAEYL